MLIVDDILFLPLTIGKEVLDAIKKMADDGMLNTEESIRKKFLETQLLYEAGSLKEEDYKRDIEYLENRLKMIRVS